MNDIFRIFSFSITIIFLESFRQLQLSFLWVSIMAIQPPLMSFISNEMECIWYIYICLRFLLEIKIILDLQLTVYVCNGFDSFRHDVVVNYLFYLVIFFFGYNLQEHSLISLEFDLTLVKWEFYNKVAEDLMSTLFLFDWVVLEEAIIFLIKCNRTVNESASLGYRTASWSISTRGQILHSVFFNLELLP